MSPPHEEGAPVQEAPSSIDQLTVTVRRTADKQRQARRRRLEKARDDAVRRGDHDTAHIAQRLLEDWST